MAQSKENKNNWMDGTVHWFDELAGEGMIKAADGNVYYVHYSAIESTKEWKSLKEKKKVKFQKIEDETFCQVSKVREV
jgi:cold shock CspA family protein